jgi:integral membrane sensor domain MASE1
MNDKTAALITFYTLIVVFVIAMVFISVLAYNKGDKIVTFVIISFLTIFFMMFFLGFFGASLAVILFVLLMIFFLDVLPDLGKKKSKNR